MPIKRLLTDGKINPQEVERLNKAFNRALHRLDLVDRDDPDFEIVARKVLDTDALVLTTRRKSPSGPSNSSAFDLRRSHGSRAVPDTTAGPQPGIGIVRTLGQSVSLTLALTSLHMSDYDF